MACSSGCSTTCWKPTWPSAARSGGSTATSTRTPCATSWGIDVPLKEMLPEDGVAHGFDNVGSALAISTELMGAYLDSADRALDVAIAAGPEPESVHLEQTLHEMARTPDGGTLLDVGDAVVVFSSGGYVPTDFPFIASAEGDYRLRIRAHAWQSEEPLVMVVRTINYQRDIRRVVGFYEVVAEPRTPSRWSSA